MHTQIIKNGGGIIAWPGFEKQIYNSLMQCRSAITTTLIGYYGIEAKHVFPQWNEAGRIADVVQRLAFLEQSMSNCFDERIRHRFIP